MAQRDYDVAVVGSGIGGLSAGALLAHGGYKTLVVESKERVGGRCSTEEYEGFKLPTGGIAIHRGSEVDEVFKRVGAQLDLVPVPRLFYRLGGKDYEMPPKGSITTMFNIINKLEVDRAKLMGGLVKAAGTEKIMGGFRKSIGNPEKERMTFKDWLLQYTDNELAHEIFDCVATSLLGGRHFELPASAMFAWFVRMSGSRDVGVPPQGHIVNMERLADVIKKNGDVWTGSPARRIVVKGKTAQGIVVEKDGSEVEISSKIVICNISPKKAVEIAGEENYDESYLRLMRVRVRPQGTTVCFVASDVPLWPEDGAAAILMLTGTRRLKSIVPLSNIAPSLAPPGQHVTFVTGPPVSSEYRLDPDEEIRQMTSDMKEHLPKFEKHGRVIKTMVKNIDDEFPFQGTRIGFGMPTETPVNNLYHVGDWVLGSGLTGTTAAAESAFRVVNMVKKRLK
ncbi:phytoene desaturase family protein [Chloroflexota bacterium]